MRSLNIAATGMLAQQVNIEVVSNNLSNLSTTGFKRQKAEFSDLVYHNIRRPGERSSDSGNLLPSGIQIGLGTQNTSIYRIGGLGDPINTNKSYDLMINGSGFFQVELPEGTTAYTRAGSFSRSATGSLVTQMGYTVLPEIVIPGGNSANVSINEFGEVSSLNEDGNQVFIGKIQLAGFVNQSGLEALGNNLFKETDSSGAPIVSDPKTNNLGSIKQYHLEASNVKPVQEITTLISAQRAYEMNSKVIKTSDEMLQVVANLK